MSILSSPEQVTVDDPKEILQAVDDPKILQAVDDPREIPCTRRRTVSGTLMSASQ